MEGRRYIAGEYMLATNNLGILGQVDAMNSPVSVNSISEKAVDNFMSSTEGLSKMLTLVPSVQKTNDAAVDTVRIRGFGDDGRGFTVNGIPGMQAMTRQSTIYIDSVDVIEGPTTGITGSSYHSTDGGTININSKKATDMPVRRFGVKYHSDAAHEEFLDIGQRSGKDNRYGLRITASNTGGERSIDNWTLKQESVYVNFDQKSDRSKTNFMVGYTHTDSKGRPYGLSVPSSYAGNALPDAPNGEINFNPVWRRDKNNNFVMTLNHEQKLGKHLNAFLNAGHFKQDWYYYTGFSKYLLNPAGDYKATSDNYSLLEKRDYAQIGLRGDFKTGDFKHDYVFGVDRQWRYYGGPASTTESGWASNIYHPNADSFAPPGFGQADAHYTSRSRASGWSLMDTITSGNEKLTLLLGVNGKSIKRDAYNQDGSHRQKNGDYYDVSPSFGINYAFDPRFAVYANHTEQFVEGTVVTDSRYKNRGEALDPFKTKQNEIGVKVKTGDFLHKLSWFDITKASGSDKYVNGDLYRVADGEQRHRGLEYTATGSIAKKWNVIGGFMYLNSNRKTSSAATNGKRPNGVPDWSATLGLEYKANDDFSGLMRANYVGTSYERNEKYKVPAYFTMDLGVKYKTKVSGAPLTLNAMCYNLFNEHYWSASDNYIHLGGPKTFMLSAAIDF